MIKGMKTGVFGGTFDPVHLGHLVLAEEARARLGLRQVLFVPAGHPWMKDRAITSAPHRLAMLQLAVGDNPAFSLSRLEIDYPGCSYTAETLARLSGDMPGERLFFFLGRDALEDLARWKDPDRVLALAEMVVFPRAGYPAPDLTRLERLLPGVGKRLHLMSGPLIQISSTEVRRRVREGLSIRYLVPRPVEEYILEKGLYKEG
jgi:nicotinate-nucleotide adenylyltransferase